MRSIIVDDEPYMLSAFARLSADVEDITLVGSFRMAEEAIMYADSHPVDLAFLDVELPGMSGIECAKALRKRYPAILIVFITAHEDYLRESNRVAVDYFIVKPYDKKVLEMTMARMRLLERRLSRQLHIRMFGGFELTKDGNKVHLGPKSKEILAYLAMAQGKEVSTESLCQVIWDREVSGSLSMKVCYNTIKRLKSTLAGLDISPLLQSTGHGYLIRTDLFDCDYYEWLQQHDPARENPPGDLLPGFAWKEALLEEYKEKNYMQ